MLTQAGGKLDFNLLSGKNSRIVGVVLQVDPAAYIDTCLYLYCSLPTRERDGGVCDTLATYARECAQQHIIIMWRTPSLCGKTSSMNRMSFFSTVGLSF